MSEEQKSLRSRITLSRALRYGGFAILIGMLVLSLVYRSTNLSEEERIEATVQAGVNQGLTAVAQQTGTPEPTAIQATVEARIEASLTAAAPTPIPDDQPPAETTPVDGALASLMTLFAPVLDVLGGMWNFAGLGGIVLQVCCCVLPPIAIVVGIIND